MTSLRRLAALVPGLVIDLTTGAAPARAALPAFDPSDAAGEPLGVSEIVRRAGAAMERRFEWTSCNVRSVVQVLDGRGALEQEEGREIQQRREGGRTRETVLRAWHEGSGAELKLD